MNGGNNNNLNGGLPQKNLTNPNMPSVPSNLNLNAQPNQYGQANLNGNNMFGGFNNMNSQVPQNPLNNNAPADHMNQPNQMNNFNAPNTNSDVNRLQSNTYYNPQESNSNSNGYGLPAPQQTQFGVQNNYNADNNNNFNQQNSQQAPQFNQYPNNYGQNNYGSN